MRSSDPAVRLEGTKVALGLVLDEEEQEELSTAVRVLVKKETVIDVKARALGLLMYTAISEENIDILAQQMLSEDYSVVMAAIDAGLMHAYISRFHRNAWKIVSTLDFISRKHPNDSLKKVATSMLERLLGKDNDLSQFGVTDFALKLMTNREYYENSEKGGPLAICDYPCDITTGDKLTPETEQSRVTEAEEFSKRLRLSD
jgi:hypothetical protein